MSDLDEDQKRIIRKIEKEAIESGLDPDFAVAMAHRESGARHIPADDHDSTAFGPFQVNKATAKTLGIDYAEMIKNEDLAIKAGINNLLRHAKNPDLGGDPQRIAAAHHWGADWPFSKTGDYKSLKPEDAAYLADIGEMLPGGDYPKTILSTQQENKQNQESNQYPPKTDQEKIEEDKNKIPENRSAANAAAVGAALGASLGSIGSAKKAAVDTINVVKDLNASGVQKYANSQLVAAGVKPIPVKELGRLTGMVIQSNSDVQKAIESLQAKPATRTPIEKGVKIFRQTPARPQTLLPAETELGPVSKVINYGGKLLSWPIKGAGLGAGLIGGMQDTYNRATQNLPGEAAISALSTAAGTAAPFVSGALGSVALPVAATAGSLYLMDKDYKRMIKEHPELTPPAYGEDAITNNPLFGGP